MPNKEIEFPSHIDLEERISNWAHDLRSPFNHMLGFTKIVLNGQSGPLTDLQKEDLRTVYHSSLRAMALVNNLIEIARLQQGMKEINREALSLEAFLDKSIAHWKKFNPDREFPIAIMLTAPNGNVTIDRNHTQTILNGFLSYLAAYSDGTGSLKVQVSDQDHMLVFVLQHTAIQARGNDEMSMEMHAAICKAYLDLLDGELRSNTIGDTEAVISFAIPLEESG